jgi:glycosyltransferase involved in cell wall biosynthesis
MPSWVDEIILVDGHSTDNTVDVARQFRPDIHILYQPGKGKGNALKFGVQRASGDIIVTLDADGQTDPEEISKFIAPLLQGYDWAKGTRLSQGRPSKMAWHRWFGNNVLTTTSNVLYGTNYTDICCGYNAFWKGAFQGLILTHDGFEMEQEMLVKIKKAGLKVIEVSCVDAGRMGGASKIGDVKQGLIDLFTIIIERFNRQ